MATPKEMMAFRGDIGPNTGATAVQRIVTAHLVHGNKPIYEMNRGEEEHWLILHPCLPTSSEQFIDRLSGAFFTSRVDPRRFAALYESVEEGPDRYAESGGRFNPPIRFGWAQLMDCPFEAVVRHFSNTFVEKGLSGDWLLQLYEPGERPIVGRANCAQYVVKEDFLYRHFRAVVPRKKK